jgi:hypothetical protein
VDSDKLSSRTSKRDEAFPRRSATIFTKTSKRIPEPTMRSFCLKTEMQLLTQIRLLKT